jgi:hypothetical protein
LNNTEEHNAIIYEVAACYGRYVNVPFIGCDEAFLIIKPRKKAIIFVAHWMSQIVVGVDSHDDVVCVGRQAAKNKLAVLITLFHVVLIFLEYLEEEAITKINKHEKHRRAKVNAQVRFIVAWVLKYVSLEVGDQRYWVHFARCEYFFGELQEPMIGIVLFYRAIATRHFIQIIL